ncbi:hypothetical protein OROMI_029039 [Orobanche minor]
MAGDDAVTERERDAYAYDRHVFLYYKNPDSWAPNSDADPLVERFASTWKARKNKMTRKTLITVCEECKDFDFSDGDALVFPERFKYSGLVESNLESFFNRVLLNCEPWHPGACGVLTRSYVYVSAHSDTFLNIIHTFKKEIAHRQMNNEISVTACSHLGWHKHPGDVLIYCRGPLRRTIGHWYYSVSPDHVPDILDQHIAKGEVIQWLPGAQMVPSVAEVEGAVTQNEDDVTQYGGDLGLSDLEQDSNKGEDILKASCVLGGVAVASAVAYALARAYISYRRW